MSRRIWGATITGGQPAGQAHDYPHACREPLVVTLDLVGDDRPGIVSRLTHLLAERGINIERLHTDTVAAAQGQPRFKVGAQLLVPNAVATEALQRDLGVLAQELMLDIALGEQSAAP